MSNRPKFTGCLLLILSFVAVAVWNSLRKEESPAQPRSPLRDLVYEISRPANEAVYDGIAVAMLMDASQSMSQMTQDLDFQNRERLQIAKLAAEDVFWEFRNYADLHPEQQIQTALYSFNDSVQTLFPPRIPNLVDVRTSLSQLQPGGGAAIGDALVQARLDLNKTGLNRQHIIIFTQGENTSGRRTFLVLRAFWELPQGQHPEIYMAGFGAQSQNFDEFQRRGIFVTIDLRNKNHLTDLTAHILQGKPMLESPINVKQPPPDGL